jgi:peptide-methionine (S)-S-oxide reductase
VQIDYDPAIIPFAELLEIFWATENACAAADSRQYMPAIFYQDDEQKRLALQSRDREAVKRRVPISTAIIPLTRFCVAEDYHQKYLLRLQDDLMCEFRAMYPDARDFMNSTAAARVNGYLGGHGSSATLRREIPALGLSPAAGQYLLALCTHSP